eukprot:m.70234 g.70234  ORF g.70234 m.70234 type:complete len:71 (-) comp10003_c0_seq1:481-693(-)
MHITPFERDWGGWGDWGDNWGRDHRDEGNAEGQPSPLSIVFAVKILVISIVIFCSMAAHNVCVLECNCQV